MNVARVTRIEYQCDMCNRSDAGTWTLETPGRDRAKVDLCPKHAEPLYKAFRAGRTPTGLAQGAELLDEMTVTDFDG